MAWVRYECGSEDFPLNGMPLDTFHTWMEFHQNVFSCVYHGLTDATKWLYKFDSKIWVHVAGIHLQFVSLFKGTNCKTKEKSSVTSWKRTIFIAIAWEYSKQEIPKYKILKHELKGYFVNTFIISSQMLQTCHMKPEAESFLNPLSAPVAILRLNRPTYWRH
jgi:hypothetical protein